MSVVSNNILAGASGQGGAAGYEIERSLRFNSGDSAYLNRTPSSAGNRRTWTWSAWVKRTSSSGDALFSCGVNLYNGGAGGAHATIYFESSDTLQVYEYSGGYGYNYRTTQLFRDPGAWYHLVVSLDTTNSTATDRLKIYVNGSRVTSFATSTAPALNFEGEVNNNVVHYISDTVEYLDGYLADVHFIDGQALAPTDFGETDDNGVWQPKEFAGTYGTNGFHLDFADNSSNAALGTDTSGNSNTWTVNNLIAGAASNLTAKQNFDVVTYTGTGSSQSISGLAFQPDFVWIKNRSSSLNHHLLDSVRGVQNVICSNTTDAEFSSSGSLTSFNANGFTVGSNSNVNGSGNNIVAWAWKAGGAASSNTDGTITSSVSANDSYGFSIAKYTGTGASASFGHGLSNAPKVVIVKKLTAASWNFYHSEVGATKTLELNSTAAEATTASWDSTAPTNSVVTVGNYVDTNDSGGDYIAYCWSEVAGFSKFGSWNGNSGSTTVTFGFKPRFILWKSKSATNWHMIDSARGVDQHLYPNETAAEANQDYYGVDFTDTGITINSSYGDVNASGSTYVYMAFAETVPADPDGDSLVDTPTNGDTASDTGAGGQITGNYATLNPLHKGTTTTLSNGNLEATNTGSWGSTVSSIGVSSGKWYAEVTIGAGTISYLAAGVSDLNSAYTTSYLGQTANSYLWFNGSGGGLYTAGAYTNQTGDWIVLCTNNDVIGLALDMDNGTLKYYKNGTLLGGGNAFTGITGTQFFATCGYSQTEIWNFGQRAFAYAAPTGFKSLNTANLPTPTIADGSLYFDTKLYTGNGSTQTISGMNMSPDFVWTKIRSSTGRHRLTDIVRGATNTLRTDGTDAEFVHQNVTAFNSDGFDIGASGNASGSTYVAWAWDAGDSNTTIAAGTAVTNQAQTWSSNITTTGNSGNWYSSYPATNIFDTTTTNYGHANGDGSVAAVVTLSFNPAITCGSSVSFYGGLTGSGTGTISINGGTAFNLTTGSSATTKTTVAFSGTISSIVVTKTSTGAEGLLIYGFEIDGTRLVDGTAFNSIASPSIASTVRANPSAGFSIVSYSGVDTPSTNTVGHGLNVAPSVYIIKNRTTASFLGWVFNTTVIDGSVDYLVLNSTAAKTDQGSPWSTLPTSSVFTLGANDGNTCDAGDDYIAYCFAPVEGYSAMGSYTGNGSADGPFVYTGHSVAWVMIKRSDGVDNWVIYDVARDTYNIGGRRLYPDLSNAESQNVSHYIDILSNGFKVRSPAGGMLNASGGNYVYMTFASNPFSSNGGLAR